MDSQSISALLAAIITLAIGLSVVLRDRRRRRYITFAVFCFVLFFWFLFRFLAITLGSDALFWVSLIFGIGTPLAAEVFFLTFLSEERRPARPLSRWVAGGTGLAYLLLIYGGLFYPIHHYKAFTVPLLLFVFAALYHCIYLLYRRMKQTPSRPESTRLTYLVVGGAAAVTLALLDFVPRSWFPVPPLGNVLVVIYMYFISQSLFHYRLLDIKELLGKMVTLATLVLGLTLVYGLLLAWVGREQSGVFFFNTLVASFVILVIYEPLRNLVEDRVNRWMFREKYEFSRKMQSLRNQLANVIDVGELVSRILGELEESARVTHASIYLADPSGAVHRLAGALGPRPAEQLEGSTRHFFLRRLREAGMLTLEGLERELRTQEEEGQDDAAVVTRNLLATMDDLEAGVAIPLVSENQLLGVLNLKDERLREAYASDELGELRKVALQAAITLRNSKAYEQLKERDRLAALGQMAAGLAHEIRNPLGAIKGAAQLLKSDDEEDEAEEIAMEDDAEAAEYTEIIVEEVDRLDRVVSQFLGYARPDRGDRQELNINDVVHRTVQLLHSRGDAEELSIKTDLARDLPAVRVDPEQLHQVFLNLGLNALQALSGAGDTLRVSTRVRPAAGPGRMVEVTFLDNGKGIPPEALDDIFIPFFTTRQRGTGLGLPICQRIVENHGGRIEVRSQLHKGSAFTVLLPTADSLTATVK